MTDHLAILAARLRCLQRRPSQTPVVVTHQLMDPNRDAAFQAAFQTAIRRPEKVAQDPARNSAKSGVFGEFRKPRNRRKPLKTCKKREMQPLPNAPNRTRTCNHPLRRRMLYPIELWALWISGIGYGLPVLCSNRNDLPCSNRSVNPLADPATTP